MGELATLWRRVHADGYAAAREERPRTAGGSFYLAVLAHGAAEPAEAASHAARAAARQPDDVLFREAARWLGARTGSKEAGVYEQGEAIAAFIRGGGNVALYKATSARLRRAYSEHDQLTLLNVGPGDGAALHPALSDHVRKVDLVEPSKALLETTTDALAASGIEYGAFPVLFENVASEAGDAAWEVAQATFSLQSLAPRERSHVLAWLAERAPRLLVEFDVPDTGETYAPARVEHVAERFRRGLGEYDRERELVSQGFLMPVLFGFFTSTGTRTNHEQPLSRWLEQLREAGYRKSHAELLSSSWWADAYFVDARTERLRLARPQPLR